MISNIPGQFRSSGPGDVTDGEGRGHDGEADAEAVVLVARVLSSVEARR